MERLFPTEYVQGYTAALIDARRIIDSYEIRADLRRHKKTYNVKCVLALLDCMIENRAILREEPDAFVRHNREKDCFEVVIIKRRKE